MKEQKKISQALENYLKEIYMMESEGAQVRVTDIAEILNISKASVNKAVNALKTQGFLAHEHYGKIELTEEGREIAQNLADNYKICYRFLTEFLDVPERAAADEAGQMSHIISRATRKKLKKFMKKQKKE